MRSLHFVVAGVLALVTARSASGRTTAEFDRQIGAELRARDPASAAVFDEANALRARGDHAGAEARYRRVFEAAPWFVHARRRQGFELLMMFRRDEALAIAREVTRASAAPEDRAFLAVVIAAKEKMSKEEWKEANELARALEREDREDAPIQQSVAGVAMRTGDLALLDSAVTNLKVLAPRDPQTLRLDAVLQLNRGRFRKAKKALLDARAAGLPVEEFQRMSEDFDRARPWWWRTLEIGGVALGFAVAVLLLVFVAGSIRRRRSGPTTPDPDAVS